MSPSQAVTVPTTYQVGRAELLRAVFTRGELTTNELADASGISRPTVARAIADLSDRGLLAPGEDRLQAIGRPARTVRRGQAHDAVLGIQVGRGEVRIHLMSLTGDRLAQTHEAVADGEAGPAATDAWFAGLERAVERVLADAGRPRERVVCTVFGTSGLVDDEGRVVLSDYHPALSGVHLRDLAEERLNLANVLVENDMSLRAIGEMMVGAARGLRDFAYFTFDGHFKPSLVLGGQVHRGAHSAVGEIGYFPREPLTRNGRSVPFIEVAAGIDSGELDDGWLDLLFDEIAHMVHAFAFIVDPEAVVVSGGRRSTDEAALAAINARVAQKYAARPVPRVLAGRRGPDVELVGILAMGLHAALSALLEVDDPPLPPFATESLLDALRAERTAS